MNNQELEFDNVVRIDMGSKQMPEDCYSYSIAVITERAIADARDGLKPAQRRILFSMHENNYSPNLPTKKCARIVGDVMGKYHPHGDSSIYQTLVGMAQTFSKNLPLIEGQGNFGSIDGDGAAAMRYCFTGDTKIMTNKGLFAIKDLVELNQEEQDAINLNTSNKLGIFEKSLSNVFIVSLNEKDTENNPTNRTTQQASKWIYSGFHKTYQVTTQNGYTVRCTENEPLYVYQSSDDKFIWKTIKDLNLGDTLAINAQTSQVVENENNDTLSYSFKLGEEVCEFNSENEDISVNLAKALYAANIAKIDALKHSDKPNYVIDTLKAKIGSDFINKNEQVQFLLKLLVKDEDSLISQLEELVFTKFTSKQVHDFVEAYNGNSKFIRTGSVKVSQFFKTLLINYFGIYTGKINDWDNHFLIEINKKLEFNSIIQEYEEEFLVPENTLSEQIIASNMDMANDINQLFDQEQLIKYNLSIYIEEAKTNSPDKYSDINSFFLMEIIGRTRSPYHLDQVSELEECGYEHVYDLTVENTHAFVANGLIAHNTEARLSKAAYGGLFNDIDKDVVDFIPNFDGSEKEPEVLPVCFPQLWVNGVEGIAVGVASSIPPHNLQETIDALLAYMDNKNISYDELMKIIPAPDFPTGGRVSQLSGYRQALETGRGSVKLTSKFSFKERKRDSGHKERLLFIEELPYKVNKLDFYTRLHETINKKTHKELNDWISEIRNNPDNVEIVLKNNAIPELVFNNLVRNFKEFLSISINYNAVVIDKDKHYRTIGMLDLFDIFLDFRREVLIRRTKFLLKRFGEKLHLTNGFMKMVEHIDDIIALIKRNESNADAKEELQTTYGLDEIQAQAILNMRLQSLTSAEFNQFKADFDEYTATIADLNDFLQNEDRIKQEIKKDLIEYRNKNARKRLTEVSYTDIEFNQADFVKKEECLVIFTKEGYVKRVPANNINTQNLKGKGKQTINLYEEDSVKRMVNASTHDNIYFLTASGQVYADKVWNMPENDKGKHIRNIFEKLDDEVVAMLSTTDEQNTNEDLSIITVTKLGKVKRSKLEDYKGAFKLKAGIVGVKLTDNDCVINADLCHENDQLMIVTSENVVNRFNIDSNTIKEQNRQSIGLDGVKLKGDEVVIDSMVIKVEPEEIIYNDEEVDNLIPDDENGTVAIAGRKYRVEGTKTIQVQDTSPIDKDKYLLTVTETGVSKKIDLSSFKLGKRKSKGLKLMKENAKTGKLIKTAIVKDTDELVITTQCKTIKLLVSDISNLSRSSSGYYIMDVNEENDTVVDIAVLSNTTE